MYQSNFKNYLASVEKSMSRVGNDPYFDWGAIFAVSFLTAAVFVSFSTILFFSINSGASTAASAASGNSASSLVPALDTADLVNLVSIFQSKNAQAPVFSATYPGPADPAVPIRSLNTISPTSTSSVTAPAKAPAKLPAKTTTPAKKVSK